MKPFIVLDLDKQRKLRFNLSAMVELEETTDIKLSQLEDGETSAKKITQVLWIMLKQEDPDLTFEQTVKLVDEHAPDMLTVINAVNKAVNLAFISKTDKGNESPNAKTPAVEN